MRDFPRLTYRDIFFMFAQHILFVGNRMRPGLSFALFYCVLFISSFCATAQEENAVAVQQGTKYLDFKIKALDKLNDRMEQQQKKLLNKLKKQ